MSDLLDPATLTPESLYRLQSDTWSQGAQYERERILALKKEIINCVIDYGLVPEKYERICNDIDALIKGEQK
jgi:hypothetical protein